MTGVCTNCHTHGGGFVPPVDPADTPHNTITDCTECHDGDDYSAGAILDNNKCLVCHGPSGSAILVETHHTPGDLDCVECHNVMRPQSNGKHIRSLINATTVVFTGSGQASDFIHQGPNYDGICEVCHTSTTYNRNNSSGDILTMRLRRA